MPARIAGVFRVGGRHDAGAFFHAGGFHHRANRCRDRIDELGRPPTEIIDLADGERGEFWNSRRQQNVGAAGLQRRDLGVDGRIRGFVRLRSDDHLAGFVAEPCAHTVDVILAEIVVLIEHGDLRVRQIVEDVTGEDARFRAVTWLPAHGPRIAFGIVPLVGAGADEKLRHFVVVEVAANRQIRRRAERLEHHQHLVFFDQLAHGLDGLWRAITVVAADEVDLAAVDAALVVDHREVGR